MAEQSDSGFTFFRKGGKGMLFLICFFIASVIWFLNALSKTYVADINYALVSPAASGKDDVPVKVIMRGQGFTLLKVYMKIHNSSYPFSTFHSSMNCIEFTDSLLGDYRNAISLVDVKPAVLTGSANLKQVTKKLPVKSKVTVSFAPQFGAIVQPLLKPDSVNVAGPAEVLSKLTHIETEDLTLQQVKNPVFRSVALKVPSASCWLQQDRVWLYVPVEEFTEATLSVQVKAPDLPNRIQLIPAKVTLKCLVPVNRFQSLTASQFTVGVVAGPLTDKEKVAVAVMRWPTYVKNIRTSPQEISLLIFE